MSRHAWRLAVAVLAVLFGFGVTATPARASHANGDYRQTTSGNTYTFVSKWCMSPAGWNSTIVAADNGTYTMWARNNSSTTRQVTLALYEHQADTGGNELIAGTTVTLSPGEAYGLSVPAYETNEAYYPWVRYRQTGTSSYWDHYPYHPGTGTGVPALVYEVPYHTKC